MQGKDKDYCLSCKLISVFSMIGIGAYLVHQGRLQKSSAAAKYTLFALGGGKTLLNNRVFSF